jgi:hypothetical protein
MRETGADRVEPALIYAYASVVTAVFTIPRVESP